MNLLIAQEIELHQYYTRHNRAAIERLLHVEFSEVGMSGTRYTLDSIVAMMGEEGRAQQRVHSQSYCCNTLAPGVCLLRYQSALVDEEGEACNFAERCSVWVLTGEQWQLKYHQGTACAPFELV
ncbi:DUF4440 domain-containing protein [Pseudoalteromonas rubra]|uniref:nuclear transport factor 2 family protein n=1 Tax=Pseudoalteromonas rubra TaxID=43658 RepID=UPI000F770680|nr:nuclear transport factor 2 family protein [Pseudoalteromonas rubra]